MDLRLNDLQKFLFLEDRAFKKQLKEEIDLELQKDQIMVLFNLFI